MAKKRVNWAKRWFVAEGMLLALSTIAHAQHELNRFSRIYYEGMSGQELALLNKYCDELDQSVVKLRRLRTHISKSVQSRDRIFT